MQHHIPAAADSTLPSQLPGGLASLPATLQDLVDMLAQCCAALQLADTRPAALAAAALQAATDAQAAQDAEEAAFEASRQLAAQIGAAQHALAELQQLADVLDAEGRGRAEDTARCTAAAEANSGKAARYAAQQAARQQALDGAGFAPELSQVGLQARGREHARLTTEQEAVQKELQAFAGLPADPDAARAATAAKRAELERLRRQLREHLDGLAAT
ncbi:HAUS augmin-like complex subunit 1 isoform X2 [Chlorella sorokiniana]|uniref:HAUS augmin-like complex subunit 1 isoform X2 n=1 Tax=Chlorella sorokiniana TaxID=3076 RepID=A0A2P6U4M8_CHLSO|nr:HAUS augmin-like complex subunit 1 isoform X2 [Chlorella sorokiniana]|eukprot:PRW61268.1 HAUS augmin-like complex subunit 1 isoform X2 [Chlorella sorokiniana]